MITLKTLHDASAQEVFDQVATHLLKQKERSSKDNVSSCFYRLEKTDGTILKCAAGALIGDDEYNPQMDNNDHMPKYDNDNLKSSMSWSNMVKLRKISDNHQSLIRELQKLHDGVAISLWKESLENFAKEHNLIYKGYDNA